MRNLSKWLIDDPYSYAFESKLGLYVRQYFDGPLSDSLISAITITPGTSLTALFTAPQAQQYFPLPFGPNSVPFAGQVFRFTFGGILTTSTTGTLVITPYYGSGTGGINMGASAAQTYTASQTNIPFRVEGEIIFRSIVPTASSSTAWLTGVFWSVGAIATAGSAWVQTFGSTAAVTVDTTGNGSVTSGSLNFGVTFSVTGASVSVEYTTMQAIN